MGDPVKILARGYKFEINTGTSISPVWVEVKGINTWSPGESKNDADTTSYDENGAQSHIPASRGGTITLTGFRLENPDDGDRDPGQEAVEALGKAFGYDGLGGLKVTSPGGEVKSGLASVNVNTGGGGVDDPAGWEAVFTKSGEWV